MKRGFTLLELLTVIAMLTVLTGALSSAVRAARQRAFVTRTEMEVREITNAILAYENFDANHSLKDYAVNDEDATEKNLAFILGEGGRSASGEKVPVLYNGAVSADGKLRDAWGTPFKVSIQPVQEEPVLDDVGNRGMRTVLYFPNFYRLDESERQ